MQYEERKTLATLLAARNKWRAIYCQTDRAVLKASINNGGGQGRRPKSGVFDVEWTKLLTANGNAHSDIRDAERKIKHLCTKILENNHNYRSELDRFLGYSFDEYETPWNTSNPLVLPDPVDGGRVPVLPYDVAGEYVQAREAVVVRSISGFNSSDVLLRAGFHPLAFTADHPHKYLVPRMVWQLSTGDWIGVDGVNVGYGGTGCDFAETALRHAGLSEETAGHIAAFRFCDVEGLDTSDPLWETSVRWPVEPRQVPEIMDDGNLVVHLGERLSNVTNDHFGGLEINRPDPDESGFYPSSHPIDGVTAWFNFLDQPQDTLPSWARGTRTITFILDDVSAEQHGYVLNADNWGISRGRRSFPSIVISQGDIQIWGHFYRKDKLRPLHPRVQELAADAGFTGQVPYLQGEPYTFFEHLGRFLNPDKAKTGIFAVQVTDVA